MTDPTHGGTFEPYPFAEQAPGIDTQPVGRPPQPSVPAIQTYQVSAAPSPVPAASGPGRRRVVGWAIGLPVALVVGSSLWFERSGVSQDPQVWGSEEFQNDPGGADGNSDQIAAVGSTDLMVPPAWEIEQSDGIFVATRGASRFVAEPVYFGATGEAELEAWAEANRATFRAQGATTVTDESTLNLDIQVRTSHGRIGADKATEVVRQMVSRDTDQALNIGVTLIDSETGPAREARTMVADLVAGMS